jgi:hypothetical protein
MLVRICTAAEGIYEVAVRKGHIECLQYAVESGGAWKVSAATAQLVSRLWDNSLLRSTERKAMDCAVRTTPVSSDISIVSNTLTTTVTTGVQ